MEREKTKELGGGRKRERRSCLFSYPPPLPSIEEADLQPWCWGEVSIRKTDLQFCPLSVWVLSFNSPISINPHLAAHPSSDISSFLSLQARFSDPKWLLKGQSRPFSFPISLREDGQCHPGHGWGQGDSPVLCRPPLCHGPYPLSATSPSLEPRSCWPGVEDWKKHVDP